MVKIDYNNYCNKKKFIIAILFWIIILILILSNIIYNYCQYKLTINFLNNTIGPIIGFLLLIPLIVFFSIQEINSMINFKNLKENGNKFNAKLKKINSHTRKSIDKDGDYHYKTYYSFSIEYFDSAHGKYITSESIPITNKYHKLGDNCLISVLDNRVLVLEADVQQIKNKLSLFDYVLTILFIIISLIIIFKKL